MSFRVLVEAEIILDNLSPGTQTQICLELQDEIGHPGIKVTEILDIVDLHDRGSSQKR